MKLRTRLCKWITFTGLAGIVCYAVHLDTLGFIAGLLTVLILFLTIVLNLTGLLDAAEAL